MIEAVIFIVACVVTAFVIVRKPKLTIPKEFKLVESEIEEWLRNPIIPSEAQPIPDSASVEWSYSEFEVGRRPTFGQTAGGLAVASTQQEEICKGYIA